MFNITLIRIGIPLETATNFSVPFFNSFVLAKRYPFCHAQVVFISIIQNCDHIEGPAGGIAGPPQSAASIG